MVFWLLVWLIILIPKLWKTQLYSKKLAETHFWFGLFGILIYYISMWASGITQGLMWRAINAEGQLVYPDFVETVTKIVPLYWVRVVGGLFYFTGYLIMVYNVVKTLKGAKGTVTEKALVPESMISHSHGVEGGHRRLEGLATVFSILTFLAILVGSVIEIYPTLNIHRYVPTNSTVSPYTSLELLGRDIYIREGCYTCHSQMIRHLDFDVLRFGEPSTVEESMYDRPFQWGSKRTGPDLARVGKKYPDLWHFRHMINPREIVAGSLMPNYPWLATKTVDYSVLRKRVSVMKMLGVPYSEEEVTLAAENAEKAALAIATSLAEQGAPQGLQNKEIVPLIAYLQALGQKKGSKGVTLSE
jgi:cytochrome c oxidase cbb3-type subunit I/II